MTSKEVISNYAHDFRDIPMNEIELEEILTKMVKEVLESDDLIEQSGNEARILLGDMIFAKIYACKDGLLIERGKDEKVVK